MAKQKARTQTNTPRASSEELVLPSYIGRTHTAIRSHLSASAALPAFLASAGTLSLADRRKLVRQALVLIESNYVHRPLKESIHGVDPVQKLRLIRHRLDQATTARMGSEYEFHREMIEVFNSVRDLHTNYVLPAPFNSTVAFLPFDLEEYFDDNERPHYIATHFVEGFSHEHFRRGVEISHWNGVPVSRAVAVSASRHAGSNLAARHVRGLDGLTIRPLARSLPPDGEWVIVGYTDRNGVARETRQDWLVSPPIADADAVDTDSVSVSAASQGIDLEADLVRQTKRMLFAPAVVGAAKKKRQRLSKKPAAVGEAVATAMPGVFSARSVDTASGTFGYVRVFTFSVDEPETFVDEFIRLIELLPQNGLMVDVRGNGGGHIFASEGLLQTLTPVAIEPEPTQFINTPLNLRICKRHEGNPAGIELGPWVESIERSVETGAAYSRGFPITPRSFANQWGQLYHGPVVLITDARCYSATDIFAAGFKDHDIGTILGVDANTGAGGANVWTHGLLRLLLRLPAPADPETPYENLPNGANMRVAIRRTLRVRERSGTPLEDLGVLPDEHHPMTKNDLLNDNVDLIKRAAEILAMGTPRRLEASVSRSGTDLAVSVTTQGLDRLDLFVDGRPAETPDVTDGSRTIHVTAPASASLLELAGYDNGSRVAARRIDL